MCREARESDIEEERKGMWVSIVRDYYRLVIFKSDEDELRQKRRQGVHRDRGEK